MYMLEGFQLGSLKHPVLSTYSLKWHVTTWTLLLADSHHALFLQCGCWLVIATLHFPLDFTSVLCTWLGHHIWLHSMPCGSRKCWTRAYRGAWHDQHILSEGTTQTEWFCGVIPLKTCHYRFHANISLPILLPILCVLITTNSLWANHYQGTANQLLVHQWLLSVAQNFGYHIGKFSPIMPPLPISRM